jgi:aspartate aminotransferase
MNVILATINPGDEVILPAPYWVSYFDMIEFAGGVPVELKTSIDDDYKVTKAQVQDAITDKTRMFLFSNPCNPSGSSYSDDELRSISEALKGKENILIVSDEIYEYINFEGQNTSMAKFESIKSRVVTVNGLSKGYAMTGYRLGFMGAPLEVAKACSKIQGQFTSGANAVTQEAAVTALNDGPQKIEYMKKTFELRRDLFVEELSKIEGFKVNKPSGAFYVLPDISYYFGKKYKDKMIENSEDFSEILLEHALVATTPGGAFGTPQTIRLSYATSDDMLIEAAKRIKELCGQITDA